MKARVVSDPLRRGQLQLSPFRSFDFDEAVVILLSDDDYSVRRAARIPVVAVRAAGSFNRHVNGHIVFARSDLFAMPDAVDVTDRLRAVT